MRQLIALGALATLLGACGTGTARAPTTSTGDQLTVAGSAGGQAPPAPRPVVVFPATDGAGVLALAGLRPIGKISYKVAIDATPGKPAEAFDLDIVQNDQQSVIHQTQKAGSIWIGFDIAERRIAWSCAAAGGASPNCRQGDPDGSSARAAAAVASLLGDEVITATFGPLVGAPGAGIGPDREAGVEVACLAGTIDGQDRRLCADANGFITEMHAGPTALIATSLSPTISGSDLSPPATPV